MISAGDTASTSEEIGIQRPSYTFQTWLRLKNVCQALRQTEDKVCNLKSEIEAKLKSTEKLREKRAELQACRMSVRALETQLEWRRTNSRTTSARLTKTRHRAADFQIRLANFRADIDELRAELAEKQRVYIGVREKLIWAAAQLFMRRRQMVQELRMVFYVEPLTILVVASLNFSAHNDNELSVGLSHVIQVLIALSRIFDFPLRYQFEFFGSRSTVCDMINSQLPNNQRIFPLYSPNQDKVAFQYGVFLLNKNVAQLRCDCGMFTHDLRCTLANLRSLFDHLADAKLEPHMYITRAIRLPDGVIDEAASSVYQKSPSSSSGALSTDSGDRSFRLEMPPSKLSVVSGVQGTPRAEDRLDEGSKFEKPVYRTDVKKNSSNNNDFDGSRSLAPVFCDDYEYKYTTENANGNASVVVNKELLKTCYLTADDEQLSQHPDEEDCSEPSGKCGLKVDQYFTMAKCPLE